MEKSLLLPVSKTPEFSKPSARPSPTAWLNGLRGVASVIVALNHYLYGEFSSPWQGFGSSSESHYLHQLPFLRVIWCGHAMPPIFFVISGYCACHSAIRLRDSQGLSAMVSSLSRSAFRRGLRLYLPVFFMAILAQVLFFCGLYNWRWSEVSLQPWHAPGTHLKYLATYLLDITNPVYPTDNGGLNLQFWVIPVEYAGSLTTYVTVLALAGTKRHLRPALLAALILPFIYRGNCHTYTFLSGLLIAELNLLRSTTAASNPSRWLRLPRRANTALFLLAWYLVGLPNNYSETPGFAVLARIEPSRWGGFAEHNWRAIAAVLLVYSMSNDARLQVLPNARVPQYLSTISWEIYLSHMMLYRLWRNPIVDFVMSWFEYASEGGFRCGFVVSAVIMATIVHWAAETLKLVNGRLVGIAKRIEAWAQDAIGEP